MKKNPSIVTTYQYRIKDSNQKLRKNLMVLSGYVNYIWNFCNHSQLEVLNHYKQGFKSSSWLSAYDLNTLTSGTSKIISIPSQTVQAVCEEYATRRKQFKKPFLNFRTNKKNRNLPWIPFKSSAIHFNDKDNKNADNKNINNSKSKNCTFTFNKLKINTWFSRHFFEVQHQIDKLNQDNFTCTKKDNNLNNADNKDLYIEAETKITTGSIVRNAEGKWFINITVKTTFNSQQDYDNYKLLNTSKGQNLTAIDPGLNPMLTMSIESPNGNISYKTSEPQRFYKKLQDRLAKAQRARKKKQIKKIHTKIKNQRKDYNYKLAVSLVKDNHTIVGTDLNYKKLMKSNLKGHAKAWSDVGLGYLTQILKSKANQHNVKYEEVSEGILKSTQTCSHCFALTGPRGRKGLGISAWTCSKCGKQHNRNENSADNHRLAYKEILLLSINSEKGNDLTDNKTEQCLEKDLKINTSFTLQDVGDLDNKVNYFIKKESPSL